MSGDPRRTFNKRRSIEQLNLSTPATRRKLEATSDDWKGEINKSAIVPSSQSSQVLQVAEEFQCQFKVLLPNGTSATFSVEVDVEMKVGEFIRKIRREVEREKRRSIESPRERESRRCSNREIRWGLHMFLEDTLGNRMEDGKFFESLERFPMTLMLQDGAPDPVHALQDMWDVTPEPELLVSLPQEYTIETALADILDNSLQAVWENKPNDRRLISVSLNKDMITIFDSGQGMDSSQEHSIARWGTMGSSNHRNYRGTAIGGEPPFLKPCFGMYGYGGLVAAMHLGGIAVVSSKTKASKKVVTLRLDKKALMERSKAHRWKTEGEFRGPSEVELKKSPHGSFTKVEISGLKGRYWHEDQLKCILKDIYFPYIQYDASSSTGKTTVPVEFEVNDTNLAEVDGGEVAITNLNSCNGAPFVVNLHFKKTIDDLHQHGTRVRDVDRANARITCFYFPIIQGKETIEKILDDLESKQIINHENFETFCRVTIRRLGRLLPDARWRRLPFMEPKKKRGYKMDVPPESFKRVKAFIDTDAGFIPLPSKTDLSHKNVFTMALESLGSRTQLPNDGGVSVEILRDRRLLTPLQLEKEYHDWVKHMHERFDEEVDCDDEPVTIIDSTYKKELGITQDVFRVYQQMRRRGTLWTSSTKIKILKGAPGNQQKDLYATLEFFLSEGLERDPGETKMICRPIEIAVSEGSSLTYEDGIPIFKLGKSKGFPIELLSSEKCIRVSKDVWRRQDEKRAQKAPGCIEILDAEKVKMLNLDKGLSSIVIAGTSPPQGIIAVVRQQRFLTLLEEGKCSPSIEQKTIVKDSMEMKLEVKFVDSWNSKSSVNLTLPEEELLVSMLAKPTARNNIHGLYCFSTEGFQFQNIFTKAGKYSFSFFLVDKSLNFVKPAVAEVQVRPSEKVGRWSVCDHPGECSTQHPHENNRKLKVRLGAHIGPLYVSCIDDYGNVKKIMESLDLRFEVWHNEKPVSVEVKVDYGSKKISTDQRTWLIGGLNFQRGNLELIKPHFQAMLKMFVYNKFAAEIPLSLLPGEISSVKIVESQCLENTLQPQAVISVLMLQGIDAYGNSVENGQQVTLEFTGLELQDNKGSQRKVDEQGCVNLGGLLKVIGPFNSKAKICVYSDARQQLFWKELALLKRRLKMISEIPEEQFAGTVLENVCVKIVDENEEVDESMDGASHTIMLDINTYSAYPLRQGACCIPAIKLPDTPGEWSCCIFHSVHHELQIEIKLNLLPARLAYIPENETIEDGHIVQYYNNDEVERLKMMAAEIIQNVEKHERKLKNYAMKVKREEDTLQQLEKAREEASNSISELKDHIRKLEHQLHESQRNKPAISSIIAELSSEKYTKAALLENVRILQNHPASYLVGAENIGGFLSPTGGFTVEHDILGLVTVLASVENQLLSRALAEFLGQDNMLAVVCAKRQAARLLENYDPSGRINENHGLHEFIRGQQRTLHGRFRVYVLSEMSVFESGETFQAVDSNHPQKLLRMKPPKMKDGRCPRGFLDYAVNLLFLDPPHLSISAINGHGLRETLFYRLFSTLQVYDTRKHLMDSSEALLTGGVSLDGGLIRGKDCVDLGTREESTIIFPVVSSAHNRAGLPLLNPTGQLYQEMQIETTLKLRKEELLESKQRLLEIDHKIKYSHQKRQHMKDKFDETKEEIRKEEERRIFLTENLKL